MADLDARQVPYLSHSKVATLARCPPNANAGPAGRRLLVPPTAKLVVETAVKRLRSTRPGGKKGVHE